MSATLQGQTPRSSRTGLNAKGNSTCYYKEVWNTQRVLVRGVEEEGDQLEAEAAMLIDKHRGLNYQALGQQLMPLGTQGW